MHSMYAHTQFSEPRMLRGLIQAEKDFGLPPEVGQVIKKARLRIGDMVGKWSMLGSGWGNRDLPVTYRRIMGQW